MISFTSFFFNQIGFNRGNGTLWYGHRPFSENAQLMQDIEGYSNVQIPGRFIFRIDEWIQPAGCQDIDFDKESMGIRENFFFFYLSIFYC